MSRSASTAVLIAAMIVVIVGADILFFRNHFWPRLAANIGIVLIFGASYFRYIHRS